MAITRVVALAGGVGGAKLAHGLARILPAGHLTVAVNIGDDFEHYGLTICPDLDTVMYTLSEFANPETGWGVRDETRNMLAMLQTYGETPWFGLGDRDLATHLLRHSGLKSGQTLTEITHRLSTALGIQQTILPASNDKLATMLDTVEVGTLAFQHYFVRHRWQPIVKRVWYEGSAQPSPEVLEAIENADAIIICPSNPILSVQPILEIGDLRARLETRSVPCVAVSPLIGGQAVKGPADKLMKELGQEASNDGLQAFYTGLIDGLMVNNGDAPNSGAYREDDILMNSIADRERLAHAVLDYAESFLSA
jgi:LPPG:FO 2-phospho-L-lactate transferase